MMGAMSRTNGARHLPPPPPWRGWVPALVFLAVFSVYLGTLHPAYRLDDSPATVAACLNLSVQHAPGYPLHTLLGRLFIGLPVGGPYFRVNLLSAVAGAAGCALVPAIVARFVPGGWGLAGGLVAGLSLGVSRLAWDQALSAKGGIYTLNLLLLFAILASRKHAGCLAAGLGLANHWMTVIYWLPGAVFVLRPWTRRKAAVAALAVAVGGSAYLQLPMGAAREPSYGDAATASGFAGVVLRRDLGGAAEGKTARDTIAQALWSSLLPLREAQLAFVLVAMAGIGVGWRRNRPLFTALASGWALTLLAVVAVANPVHRRTGDWIPWFTAPFLLPCLAALAPLAGAALANGLSTMRPLFPLRRSTLILFFCWGVAAAVPLSLWRRHLPKADHSMDYAGFDYAENLRASVPGAGRWFMELEFNALPVIALRHVENRVADVIVTNPYLERRWGWVNLRRTHPGLTVAVPESTRLDRAEAGERIAALAAQAPRTSAYGPGCSYPALKARQRPAGIAQRMDESGSGPPLSRFRRRGLYGELPHKDELVSGVLDAYLEMASRPADVHRRAGRIPETIAGYERAVRLPGRVVKAATLRDLGIAYAIMGNHARAEASFRASVKLVKRDWLAWTNLAVSLEKQGKSAEAGRIRRRIPAGAVIR